MVKEQAIIWTEQTVSVDKLQPYEKNPRKISPEDYARLVDSIRQDGYHQRILATPDLRVIGGHQRIKALAELGITEVSVLVPDREIDEAQYHRILVRDNVEYGEWEIDALTELMPCAELIELGVDDDDLPEDELQEVAGEDEAPPVPTQIRSKLGDIWMLGEHRLMCGSATSADDIALLMDGQLADLIVTDPPYGVDFERGKFVGREKAAKGRKFEKIINDELKGDGLKSFITDALVCAYAVAKDAPIYVWSPPLAEGYSLLDGVRSAGFKVQSQIVWRKTPFVIGRADYHWQHEICWYGFKGKSHPWYGGRDKATVWDFPKMQKMDLHPTMKPVALIETAINNSSKGGDIVLDVFGGSGTTLIACQKQKRRCFMMELAPEYIDVIITRWQDFTGCMAFHAETGKTFEETAAV